MSDIESRLDRLESELAIIRLAYEYNHGVDKRDIKRFLAVWHPDAEWLPGPGVLATGHDEIGTLLETGIWPAFNETHHWAANVVVDLDGDSAATGVCDVDATVRDVDGQWLRASATYNDRCVRHNGRWLYARREAILHFQEPLG